MASTGKFRAFLWNGCSRVHRTLNSESATSPATVGPPLPRGPQNGTESELPQSTLKSCGGWVPGTSLTASGWSHSSGTARCPCYSPEAIPDSVCTMGPQHHHCWTDLLARRPAWVCTYLGSRVSTPPPHRTGWGRVAACPPPARNFTFQPGSSLPDPSPSPSRGPLLSAAS